ncbi:PAS domain-containing protein [Sphingomonas glaciei]|uniref:histidine kinase n=1 Tax=Sphingomonas glaciei TaxID=2938948 RepID=A0ABY5MU91_9SPHN|nr:PAS domain-containing protein [Sphingomonas glaciei]UUR07778.1 PAS domain-containing protein [Sphingomonas glaciei]
MSAENLPAFLAWPSETAGQIAAADWAAVGFVPPSQWPESLKGVVGMMLRTPVPMVVLWGEQGLMIYNDGYGVLTQGVNKIALPVAEAWPEAADWNLDILRKVRAGRAETFRNIEFVLHRHGRHDTIFFNLAYSPLLDDKGQVDGVLAVVNETTKEVLDEQIRSAEEARQRAMLDQMPGFAAVLTGPEHVFSYVNDAYRLIGGERDYVGRPVREVFPEFADQGFFDILDRVYASGERYVDQRVAIQLSQNTEISFIELLFEPIRNEAGAVIGIFVGGYDSTTIHRAVIDLAEREAFLSEVLRGSTDCIKVLDLDGRLTFMSEGGQKVMEVDDFAAIADCPWPDFWEAEGNQRARDAIAAARSGKSAKFIGAANTAKGTPKWWDVSVAPIFGPDGKPARILSVSRDTTELVAAQEQQRLLNAELGHRLKNVLTMVQAIASQTFRRAQSVEEVAEAFAARLTAFGKATDVLTATSWNEASLKDIVASGLSATQGFAERIDIEGGDVTVPGPAALALTLALHELATNACKYGALSNPDGRVAIHWDESGGQPGSKRFRFKWKETGGPPVSAPQKRGFGSRMIERSLQSYFAGHASLRFDPAGVEFSIDGVMPTLADDGRS